VSGSRLNGSRVLTSRVEWPILPTILIKGNGMPLTWWRAANCQSFGGRWQVTPHQWRVAWLINYIACQSVIDCSIDLHVHPTISVDQLADSIDHFKHITVNPHRSWSTLGFDITVNFKDHILIKVLFINVNFNKLSLIVSIKNPNPLLH
jgi:hypothetical protein